MSFLDSISGTVSDVGYCQTLPTNAAYFAQLGRRSDQGVSSKDVIGLRQSIFNFEMLSSGNGASELNWKTIETRPPKSLSSIIY